MRNNQFVGKRKLKNCWGDEVYTVCNKVDVDVPMNIIKNQQTKANPSPKLTLPN